MVFAVMSFSVRRYEFHYLGVTQYLGLGKIIKMYMRCIVNPKYRVTGQHYRVDKHIAFQKKT